jgi:hypothetical protein
LMTAHNPSMDLRISVLSKNSNNTDYPRSIIIQDNTDTFSIIKCF